MPFFFNIHYIVCPVHDMSSLSQALVSYLGTVHLNNRCKKYFLKMWNIDNKNFKVLIVQDYEKNTNTIEISLKRYGFQQLKSTDNLGDALRAISNWQPDFVLLDIHFEGSTLGLELAKQLSSVHHIPFIYICKQIEAGQITEIVNSKPSGILLHPLNELQFVITMNRMIDAFHKKNEPSLLDLRKKERISQEDIMYLQAYGNYWEVITSNGKKLVRKSYSEIINSYPENHLQRIHRSYIVNKNAVTKYSSCKVQLINGLTLPISRTFQQELKNIG